MRRQGRKLGRARASGIAVAGVVTALAVLPGGAGAAFDSGHERRCQSAGTIQGIGSSFQRAAQLAWGAMATFPGPAASAETGFGYLDLFDATSNPLGHGCPSFAVRGTNVVMYEPSGSGEGRKALGASVVPGEAGVRNRSYAFAGVDEAPTTAQIKAANDGPDRLTGTSDDAVLRTIPLAQSAVAVVVKLPAGCTLAAGSNLRRISRATLAGAFAAKAEYREWGQVLPAIVGPGCATKPIQRVVRTDDSGTTFAFKRYLASISADAASAFSPSLGNTTWPNDSGVTTAVRSTLHGGGAQLDRLSALGDGGLGYADLATARAKGYDWVTGGDSRYDERFWLYVERAPREGDADGVYVSPAVSNNASASGTAQGAKCFDVGYVNGSGGPLPATTASWYDVSAVSTTADYPVCALTYALAWERPSRANGSLPWVGAAYTQQQARAVRDYLGYAVDAMTEPGYPPVAGQSQLVEAGYRELPEQVRAAAIDGVTALNW